MTNRSPVNRRVALITDNPYRDLPGIVLVARRLAAEGVTCYLVPMNLEWREVGALAPDVVLLTNIRRPRQEFARRLVEAGIAVGVLETEGGVMPDFDTYTTMTGPDPDLFRRLSVFCAWGPRVAAHARDSGWYEPGQIVVTGAPRFDLYAPQWRQAALAASSSLAAYHHPLILVNGSFPRANPRFVSPQQEVELWQSMGFSRDHIVRLQDVEGRALRGMVEVANGLARAFPDAKVVYRPHPFERVETYEPLLESRDNLELLKVGTAEGWILRATVIVHRNSTTAIEAAMAGKPALLPTWLPTAETLEACDAVSVKCDTVEVLAAEVRAALDGRWTPTPALLDATERVIADWFYVIDGASHERVAAALLPHILATSGRVRLEACRRIHYGWRPGALTLRSRVGILTRMALGVPVTWSFARWEHRDPGDAWVASEKSFDVRRVRSLLDAMDGGTSPLVVRHADNTRDYRVSCRAGRTVVVEPNA